MQVARSTDAKNPLTSDNATGAMERLVTPKPTRTAARYVSAAASPQTPSGRASAVALFAANEIARYTAGCHESVKS